MSNKSPLLDFSGMPRYPEINQKTAYEGMFEAVFLARENVDRIILDVSEPTWENFIIPVFEWYEMVQRAWKTIDHIHNVQDNAKTRSYYEEEFIRFEEFDSDFFSSRPMLYMSRMTLEKDPNLTETQKQVLKRLIFDLERSGAQLEPNLTSTLKAYRYHLASTTARFDGNLQHCNDDYALLIDDVARLNGVPEDVIETLKVTETNDEGEEIVRYKLTLHAPSYQPIMRFADDRDLRQTLYNAYVTRASDLGREYGHSEYQGGIDENGVYLKEILRYRQIIAEMLGYKTIAEQVLESRMLKSADQVVAFLKDLAQKARPYAEKDYEEMKQYATETLGLDELQSWDIPYVSEKMQQARFGFSDQEIRQYFPLEKALEGMFETAKTLFGIDIQLAPTPPVLHDSVRFYEVSENGQTVGYFYFDPYARTYKHGGAWMDEVLSRQINPDGTVRYPVAHLVTNFTEPVENYPSLLTHDEVLTLFHEFGHVLHHVLTEVDEAYISGINKVEWDAVELPSQFMENFAWEWSVVESLTSHVETGEPMPKALFDKMVEAKNFQVALRMLKQIEYALFDMYLHNEFDPKDKASSHEEVLKRVRDEVAVIFPPEIERFPQSFSHIFAGGYGAGYYSYKWSDILSADAFSLFKEKAQENEGNILLPELGQAFRKEILAVGATRPMAESFEAFRGRQPTIDAYLEASFGPETAQ